MIILWLTRRRLGRLEYQSHLVPHELLYSLPAAQLVVLSNCVTLRGRLT